jgi:hypothetical protein
MLAKGGLLTWQEYEIIEIGVLSPTQMPLKSLQAGEVRSRLDVQP